MAFHSNAYTQSSRELTQFNSKTKTLDEITVTHPCHPANNTENWNLGGVFCYGHNRGGT